MPENLFTLVSVSRRSAAGSCTDVQDTPRKSGERFTTNLRVRCARSFEQMRSCRACWKHGYHAAGTRHSPAKALAAAGGSRRWPPTDRVRVRPIGLRRAFAETSVIPTSELGSQLFG